MKQMNNLRKFNIGEKIQYNFRTRGNGYFAMDQRHEGFIVANYDHDDNHYYVKVKDPMHITSGDPQYNAIGVGLFRQDQLFKCP
jgi:hypothetical protein